MRVSPVHQQFCTRQGYALRVIYSFRSLKVVGWCDSEFVLNRHPWECREHTPTLTLPLGERELLKETPGHALVGHAGMGTRLWGFQVMMGNAATRSRGLMGPL